MSQRLWVMDDKATTFNLLGLQGRRRKLPPDTLSLYHADYEIVCESGFQTSQHGSENLKIQGHRCLYFDTYRLMYWLACCSCMKENSVWP